MTDLLSAQAIDEVVGEITSRVFELRVVVVAKARGLVDARRNQHAKLVVEPDSPTHRACGLPKGESQARQSQATSRDLRQARSSSISRAYGAAVGGAEAGMLALALKLLAAALISHTAYYG
jgi:hypothetical protein